MKSLFLIAFALLLVGGCSDGDEVLGTTATPQSTPGNDASDVGAIELFELLDGQEVRRATVRGFVVWDDSSARLCEVLAESFPPQCGGLAITIANPEVLDVELDAAGGVRWTQGFVTIAGLFGDNQFVVDSPVGTRNGARATGGDNEPSIEDQALADAFLSFVADPSFQQLAQLNLAGTISLGLGDEITKTVPSDVLIDRQNWMIPRDEFRGWSGPFSALWMAEPPVVITVGPHLRCVAEPVAAPPGFADHRRVSLQPETATSCLEWWTVDFFLAASGQIEAITLDLFAP